MPGIISYYHQVNLHAKTEHLIEHEIKTHNARYVVLTNHTQHSSPPPQASKLAAAFRGVALSRNYKEIHFQLRLTQAVSLQIIDALKNGLFKHMGINLETTLFLESNPIGEIRSLFFQALPASAVAKLTLKIDKETIVYLAKAITLCTKLRTLNGNFYAIRKKDFNLLAQAINNNESLTSIHSFRGFYTQQKQLENFKQQINKTLRINRLTYDFLQKFSKQCHFTLQPKGQNLIAAFIHEINENTENQSKNTNALKRFKEKDWANQIGPFLTPRDGLMLSFLTRRTRNTTQNNSPHTHQEHLNLSNF